MSQAETASGMQECSQAGVKDGIRKPVIKKLAKIAAEGRCPQAKNYQIVGNNLVGMQLHLKVNLYLATRLT